MAEKLTIARPYARAAFQEARGDNKLAEWADALKIAAQGIGDDRVSSLIGNPRVLPGELAQLVIDVAGSDLGQHGANFVRTLAENRRLALLPEISEQFESLKNEVEGTADVTVVSAAALDEAQQKNLAAALERRLKRAVRLHYQTDAGLIGGAVIRSGDLVIDGSLRSRLENIAYDLTA